MGFSHYSESHCLFYILVKFYTPCMSFKMSGLNNSWIPKYIVLWFDLFKFFVLNRKMWIIYDGVWHVKYWGHHNLKMIYHFFVLIFIPVTGRNLLHIFLRFCNISFVIEIFEVINKLINYKNLVTIKFHIC